jgi:hypothetical protein
MILLLKENIMNFSIKLMRKQTNILRQEKNLDWERDLEWVKRNIENY